MTTESFVFEITLNACCLLFIVFIGIVYAGKKVKKNHEIVIYRHLLIFSIIDVIFELFYLLSTKYISNVLFIGLAKKMFFIMLMSLFVLLVYYIFIVIYEKNVKFNSFLDSRKWPVTIALLLSAIVMAIVEILLPVNYAYNSFGHVQYLYGPAVWFPYIACAVICLTVIPFVIYNIKSINRKKTFPYFMVLLFEFITLLVSIVLPDICVASVSLTLICYLMYHAIENPDLKLLQELEVVKDEAVRANQAKSDFLSSMSHELRTPLNVILGLSQSLLEQDLNNDVKDDINDIVSASDTLLGLVNEILDISKIESNKLQIVEMEYSSVSIFKYLVTMTEARLGGKSLEFIHEYDENIPPVLYGDSTRIKQVAVNFLTNAVKYTRDGYIKLDIKLESIDKDFCYIIISVSDSGMGIREEDIGKLFSKFERFDLKKNANIEGTGLGLALTKQLVDLMGGEISVDSKYGVGSTFKVKFRQKIVNKKLEELEYEVPIIRNQHFVGHGERVLVVDDNNLNLKVVDRLLKSYKLEIDYVNSGKECLNKITSGNKYDIVFLDDQMPEMTGMETMQHLKRIPSYDVPTIALTANAITGMREKYLNNGFSDYLSKPIDRDLLKNILIKFLGSSDVLDKRNSEIIEESSSVELLDDNTSLIDSDDILDSSYNSEKLNEEFLRNNGVDLTMALEFLGDMEMYNATVNDFVLEIDTKIADIQKFYESKDMPNYAILVHSLKSDAKYLGFTKLAELSYNHEMASKRNDYEYVISNYEELMNEARRIIDIIKRYNG